MRTGGTVYWASVLNPDSITPIFFRSFAAELKTFLQEKAVEDTKQKEERRKKHNKPDEEQEGMPKRRGERNPECHPSLWRIF
jgi:hypothetical protein